MSTTDSLCPVCHFGRLKAQKITYTEVFEGEFIVIPNVAALVCDVCGEKVFDNDTLTRLSGLLGQERQDMRNILSRHSWP
jgi:YgiT-type zinc finger domain-containing protein